MIPEDEATQEARMRRWLVSQGYQQSYGTTDAEIRRRLGISGKCADFVGYHPQQGNWLIAESKGGDIEAAYLQITNTLQGLLARESAAVGNTKLQIFISAQQYERLSLHGLSGYFVRDGFLGNEDEQDVFHFILLDGERIQIKKAEM
jgi:hypothetical protein